MLGYIDLAGVRFAGPGAVNRRVTNVIGLPGIGSAGPRVSSYDAPSRHGTVTRSRWMKGAVVTIEGLLHGGSSIATQAEYDALSIPLLDAIDTDALLTWQRPDGVELQAVARLAGPISIEVISGPVWRYQANVSLDDPRGFSQSETIATGGTLATSGGATYPRIYPRTYDPGTGGTVAVVNSGTRPSPPTFTVFGYASAPQILLVGTDKRIALTGVIAPGDFLEINVKERTARLNGSSPSQGLIDSANTTWFDLPRGASTLRLLAGASDSVTRCDVRVRAAYA